MNNRCFFRAGNLLRICCFIHWLFFSFHTYAYQKKTFPLSEQLKQASQAVGELWAINVYASSLPLLEEIQIESGLLEMQKGLKRWAVFLGNGFFIAPEGSEQSVSNLLLADCNSIRRLLENGKSLQDLQIYNSAHWDLQEEKSPSKMEDLIALDCISNLALLKTKNKVPSFLTINPFPPDEEETLFVLDHIAESHRLIKQTGQAHWVLDHLYFPANHSHINHSIGSPVTNRQGQVAGVVFGTTANMVFSWNASRLTSFINGETGVRCEGKSPWDCLREAIHKVSNSP